MNKKQKVTSIILKAFDRIFSVTAVLTAILLFQSLTSMDMLPQKYTVAVAVLIIVLIGLSIAMQFGKKTKVVLAGSR